jgi:predicted HD superfamily hydrolase involved in NAD metabolism
MDCIAIRDAVAGVLGLLELRLSPGRRNHSLAVAVLARSLCGAAGVDPARGYLAGLAHDLAREMSEADLLRLAGQRRTCTPLELAHPVLVHGRAAAALVHSELGLEDASLLQALEDHVTGRPGMGALSKIVFVADFLEPGRGWCSSDFRRQADKLTLSGQVVLVLERVFAWLRAENRPIAPASLQLHKELTLDAQKTSP